MNFLDKIINRIFPSPILYVRLYRNEVEVLNVNSNITIRRKSFNTFSNKRLLIADFRAFEAFFKEVVIEVLEKRSVLLKNSSFRVLVQPIDSMILEVSSVESRVFQDSFFQCGAKEILIDKSCSQKKYSNKEVLAIFNSRFERV